MSKRESSLPLAVDAETPLSQDELAVLRKQYEREQPKPSVQTKFNYAWGLVKSNDKQNSRLGVRLLIQIFEDYPDRQRECLYYIALGYYKLGEYASARRYNDLLLSMEPNNEQSLSLRTLIDNKVAKDGLLGMTIAGGAIAAIAGITFALLKSKKK